MMAATFTNSLSRERVDSRRRRSWYAKGGVERDVERA